MYKAFSCLLMALLVASTVMVAHADVKVGANDKEPIVHRSSDLIGKAIKNKAGEHVGYLEDLVITGDKGRIVYAALSTKNALGLGGKLYALPFSAFWMAPNREHLILDVPKNEFENKAGFDSNNWPQQSDERWADKARKGAPKVAVEKGAKLLRLTSLNGLAVKNNSGQDLGKVQGFGVDARNLDINYMAMSHGGVVGFGSKYFAIPWEALNLKSLDLRVQDRCFVINATKQQFEQGTGFNPDNWPAEGNRAFLKNGKNSDSK